MLTPFALSSYFSAAPPSDRSDAPVSIEASEQLVEGLMSAISRSKTPLPLWAVDMANRAYSSWKLQKLSRKTEEIEKEVVAILQIVSDVRNQMEMGRTVSERESRLTRKLLEAHGRRLDDLITRIAIVEHATKGLADRTGVLEARNGELKARNAALEARNRELERRFFRDRCGAGRRRLNGRCEEAGTNPR